MNAIMSTSIFYYVTFMSFISSTSFHLNYLCDGRSTSYSSCLHSKLRILVIDYGYVDSMTGAANRHLGLLYALGALGHDVYRAALRVGPTKDLPDEAKKVFSLFRIRQHPKRLLNFKSGSVEEYVSLVREWKPDIIVQTLWFCGPTLNATVPGYLLSVHKSLRLPGRVIIESSDVHSVREEYFSNNSYSRKFEQKSSKDLTVMRQEEARIYLTSDAIFAISDRDKGNMVDLVERVINKQGSKFTMYL